MTKPSKTIKIIFADNAAPLLAIAVIFSRVVPPYQVGQTVNIWDGGEMQGSYCIADIVHNVQIIEGIEGFVLEIRLNKQQP